MLTYTITILSTAMFAWLHEVSSKMKTGSYPALGIKRASFAFLLFSFLSIFLLSALRVDVGIDYPSYTSWFDNLYTYESAYFEPGFTAMIQIIQYFTLDAQWLFIASSAITLSLVFISAKKYSPMFAFSIFLFCTMGFLSHSFNLTRQFIAIAIVLFAYGYIVDKKLLKYLTTVIVASLFHKTALIMLPAYFLLRMRPSKFVWLAAAVAATLLTIFKSQVISFVVENFYPQYYDKAFVGETIGSSYYMIVSATLIGSVLYFIQQKRLNLKVARDRIIVNLVLTVALLHVVLNWMPLSNRVSLYFDVLLILIIPQLIKLLNEKTRKRIVTMIAVAYFTLAAFLSFSSNANGVLPYKSVVFGCTNSHQGGCSV